MTSGAASPPTETGWKWAASEAVEPARAALTSVTVPLTTRVEPSVSVMRVAAMPLTLMGVVLDHRDES
jgi:hypothetical protein